MPEGQSLSAAQALQAPLVQLRQTPWEHTCPVGHGRLASHCGQLVALQEAHTPLAHTWPAAHSLLLMQGQRLLVPALHPGSLQTPLRHTRPVGQSLLLMHGVLVPGWNPVKPRTAKLSWCDATSRLSWVWSTMK